MPPRYIIIKTYINEGYIPNSWTSVFYESKPLESYDQVRKYMFDSSHKLFMELDDKLSIWDPEEMEGWKDFESKYGINYNDEDEQVEPKYDQALKEFNKYWFDKHVNSIYKDNGSAIYQAETNHMEGEKHTWTVNGDQISIVKYDEDSTESNYTIMFNIFTVFNDE